MQFWWWCCFVLTCFVIPTCLRTGVNYSYYGSDGFIGVLFEPHPEAIHYSNEINRVEEMLRINMWHKNQVSFNIAQAICHLGRVENAEFLNENPLYYFLKKRFFVSESNSWVYWTAIFWMYFEQIIWGLLVSPNSIILRNPVSISQSHLLMYISFHLDISITFLLTKNHQIYITFGITQSSILFSDQEFVYKVCKVKKQLTSRGCLLIYLEYFEDFSVWGELNQPFIYFFSNLFGQNS